MTKAVIKTLEKNGYIEIVEEKVARNPFIHKKIKKDTSLRLTEEQQNAFDKITINEFKDFLLYGITGSREDRDIFTAN